MATGAVYYNIDWQKHASLPADMLYFYAEYRQAQPNKGWTDDWKSNAAPVVLDKKNLTGEGNYVILDTEGPGQYVGVSLSVLQNQGDWWGEGDEMMFIDNPNKPTITGTGSEDYFLGAWCYGNCGINPFGSNRPTFAYQSYGNPVNGGDDRGAAWTVYRFHLDSPVPFNKSFKISIEHGHANARSDNFYTVAFWYQKGPHKNRAPLPPVEETDTKADEHWRPNHGSSINEIGNRPYDCTASCIRVLNERDIARTRRLQKKPDDGSQQIHHGEDPDNAAHSNPRKEYACNSGAEPDTDARAKIED